MSRQFGYLNSAKASDRWTLNFPPDTLFIQNYTAWPVYLRFDHQTADVSSYHVMIPPACNQTMAVQTAVFSATLAIPTGATWGGNDRVDLVFLAGETPPYAAQFSLLQIPQQFYPYDLTVLAPQQVIACDLSAYPVWGFTICPSLANSRVSIDIEYSADNTTWIQYARLFVAETVNIPLSRYYTAIMHFIRLTLTAAAPFGCRGSLTISQLNDLPSPESFIRLAPSRETIFPFTPAPLQVPTNFTLVNVAYLNGSLKGLHLQLNNFPLTASRNPPFIFVTVFTAWGGDLCNHLSNSSPVQADYPAPLQGDLVYCRYNAAMTLQSVAYNWRCSIPIRSSINMYATVYGPDGLGVLALDPSATIAGHYSIDLEV